MTTSLADHLRSLPDESLAALLQLRPDLVVPVPADISALAIRAQSRVSVARALDGLDQFTRDLISDYDLTDGLWNAGWMNEWPALYTLMSGNPLGRFGQSLDDILLSVKNAHERAPDYAAQHAVGRLEDDPALQGEQGS